MFDQGPTLINALQALEPSRQWTVRGNVYEGIAWGDDDTIPRHTKERVEAKLKELIDAQPLKELRQERNRRLAQTDYLFTSDFPHATPEKKQEWFEYRQALRDLPTATEDPVNPVWPVAPTS